VGAPLLRRVDRELAKGAVRADLARPYLPQRPLRGRSGMAIAELAVTGHQTRNAVSPLLDKVVHAHSCVPARFAVDTPPGPDWSLSVVSAPTR